MQKRDRKCLARKLTRLVGCKDGNLATVIDENFAGALFPGLSVRLDGQVAAQKQFETPSAAKSERFRQSHLHLRNVKGRRDTHHFHHTIAESTPRHQGTSYKKEEIKSAHFKMRIFKFYTLTHVPRFDSGAPRVNVEEDYGLERRQFHRIASIDAELNLFLESCFNLKLDLRKI